MLFYLLLYYYFLTALLLFYLINYLSLIKLFIVLNNPIIPIRQEVDAPNAKQ